jgi:hypothetical protein
MTAKPTLTLPYAGLVALLKLCRDLKQERGAAFCYGLNLNQVWASHAFFRA